MVLVVGETGTGKGLVARALHLQSARARGPFIELNCTALPENLVEEQLFGRERLASSGADERWPGLIAAAERNAKRGSGDVALFETGTVTLPDPEAPAAPGAIWPNWPAMPKMRAGLTVIAAMAEA